MEHITLSLRNTAIKQEIINFLQHFSTTDVEVITVEDMEDLMLLKNTRHEEAISFSDYLKNAD
jgi:hypothetical protein